MGKERWTLEEVVRIFDLEEAFLLDLEEEEIVCCLREEPSGEKLYPCSELEKLRIVKVLVDELGVNLPGVDIILRMRRDMISVRRQFDAILDDLAKKIRSELERERREIPGD